MTEQDDDLARRLGEATSVPPGSLDRLRQSMAARARADGLVDLSYRIVDSPYGPLLLARSDRGLVRVAFELEGFDRVLDDLSVSLGPRVLRSDAALADDARQMEEYFDGDRRRFDIAVDLRLVHGFRHDAVVALSEIPYGTTESYKDLARRAGRPTAVRAAGSACANNPVPIVVPCHRIVRSDGSIGNYLGGAEVKTALIELERR